MSLSKEDLAEHLYELQLDAKSELGIHKRQESIEILGETIKQAPSLLHDSTGAMVWRSTIEFAAFLRQNPHHKLAQLIKGTVVELGCGTGALARLLSPLCTAWVATDQKPLLKLARENTSECSNVKVKKFDWELDNAPDVQPDCVVSCDTIYNEYLVTPFLDAFEEVRHGAPMILIVQIRELDMLEVAFTRILERFAVTFELVVNGVAIYTMC